MATHEMEPKQPDESDEAYERRKKAFRASVKKSEDALKAARKMFDDHTKRR